MNVPAKFAGMSLNDQVDEETLSLLITCLEEGISFTAKKYLHERHTLAVCQSGAGYYLGCWDGEGPVARDSDYYPSHADAEEALLKFAWEQRTTP